jgi:5-methylcytosine-specific restriction endonuclease McrA
MKKPDNPKEQNLVKGALRRIFSRSDLRKAALAKQHIIHSDTNRPRVTKWSWCAICGVIEPTYTFEVDHIEPVIQVKETLNDLTLDQLAERIWCSIDNLQGICENCHKKKTKEENRARRDYRKNVRSSK